MKRIFTLAGVCLLSLTWTSTADAVHYNRGHFVQAFQPCDPVEAGVTTSGGVPACAPAVPVSHCAAHPQTALRLRPPGETAFTYRSTGRRETRANDDKLDILARIALDGVETCDGQLFTGMLSVRFEVRMFRQDPACGPSGCVLPDFSFPEPLPCKKGRCGVLVHADDTLVAAGRPPLPSDELYTIRYNRIAILDPGGNVFLTTGIEMAEGSASVLARPWRPLDLVRWLFARIANVPEAFAYGQTTPRPARRLLARYVEAHEACDESSTDTATSDGLPACKAVPLSNCALDPGNALTTLVPIKEHTHEGRAKLDLKFDGSLLRINGNMSGIQNCGGSRYTGPLDMRAMVRATVLDPGCGAEPCTTIDTELFRTQLDIVDGEQRVSLRAPLEQLGSFPVSAATVSAEILEIRMLDRAGNVFFAAPSTFVRCNGHGAGETGFCFGN